MTSVELIDLAKVHGNGVRALDGVDLHVGAGELVVIAGPSGSGKTTLLRLVAGLERPTRGAVRFADRDVTGLAPDRRDVAMVFQEFALYPHLTVRRNIAFALRSRGLDRAEIDRRTAEAAALTGITGLLDRRPGTLSGGEGQRAALARVIARRAACTLFDEPLASVDAGLRRRLRIEIRDLQRRLGLTTLFVTHDQAEAMALADRIAILVEGQVRQVGSPRDVYDRPADRTVAAFVGDPAMNLLPGRIATEGGATRFEGEGGDVLGLASRFTQHEPCGPCVLGVRPEDLAVTTGDGVRATVVAVEALGAVAFATVRTAGDLVLVAGVPSRTDLKAGDTVALRADPARVHLFAADGTGRRLDDDAVSAKART